MAALAIQNITSKKLPEFAESLVQDIIPMNFEYEGDYVTQTRWVPLSDSYFKDKKFYKAGGGPEGEKKARPGKKRATRARVLSRKIDSMKVLELTGQLLAGWEQPEKIAQNTYIIFNRMHYAWVHQFGSPGENIPKREMLGFSDKDCEFYSNYLLADIEELFSD